MKIEVTTVVEASAEQVWQAWVNPEDIKSWNFATDEWCCPEAEVNLNVGERFNYKMAAKDGSMAFNFGGTFTNIEQNKSIQYRLDDDRMVSIDFTEVEGGIKLVETFDADNDYPLDQQQQGWQSILDNFKNHVESRATNL